jgi:quercetin dioxygenase-like cupin family protein
VSTTPEALACILLFSILLSSGCAVSPSPELRPKTEPGARTSRAASVAAPTLPDPLAAGWRGKRVCETLHENARQRILRCTFPPGVGHERHFHAPHFGYVVTGSVMRITDESGTREVEIDTGSTWTSEGTAWHEVVNVGETTGVYLIVEPK